jgi:hypothetical protein
LIQYDIPSEYHSFVFGTKQAGINDFDNVVHEICHSVQFQDMSRSMYGCFQFKEPESVSHNCSATMRELEVMAMASFFHTGDEIEYKNYSKQLIEWLYDYVNFITNHGFDELWEQYKNNWSKTVDHY